LKTECDTSTVTWEIDNTTEQKEEDVSSSDDVLVEHVQQTYSAVQQTEHQPIESVVDTPKPVTGRMGRSVTEDLQRTKPTELKSILRSISFHRPDIATYNMPLGTLRRTDSNNDVWVESAEEKPQHQQSTPVLSNKTSKAKPTSTWKRLSRVFSFKKSKPSVSTTSTTAAGKPK